MATENGAVEYGIDALKLDLERGRVHQKSLVWRKGMQDWVELDQVPLLRMLVTVEAHPSIHSRPEVTAHAIAPASTAVFDELFEEKTTVFVRHTSEPDAVTPEAEPAPADGASTAIFDGLFGDSSFHEASPQSEPRLAATDPHEASPQSEPRLAAAENLDVGQEGQVRLAEAERKEAPPTPATPKPANERATLTRPQAPRVSIPGVLAFPAGTTRSFQVPKPEPIAEGLATTTLSPTPQRPAPAAASTVAGLASAPAAVTTQSVASPSSAAAPRVSPTRAEGHVPIPAPPPLRHASVPTTHTPATVASPKAAPARTETRLPIPAPPPLPQTPAPVARTPNLALPIAPKTEPVPLAPVAAHEAEQEPAAPNAQASQVPESTQPALKALTALTQASVAATIRPAPAAHAEPAKEATGSAPAPGTRRAEPESQGATSAPKAVQNANPSSLPLPLALPDITGRKSQPAVAHGPTREASTEKDPLADSIYPSISSIQPGLLRARPSKRTVIIVAGLTAAAAALAIIVRSSTPDQRAAPATSIEHSGSTTLREHNTSADRPAAAATKPVEPPAAQQADVVETAEAAPLQKEANAHLPQKRELQQRSDPTATSRRTSSGPASVPVAKSGHASGVTPTNKPGSRPGTGEPSTSNSNETVATWEQGPVEKRPWMAPGF